MKAKSAGSSRGFTLMEMILVLGIIALLIGIGSYFMVDVLGDAEEAKAKADISALNASLHRYRTRSQMYPTTEQGLDALVKRPVDGPQPSAWKALLREEALMDPWMNKYQYRYPGKYNPETYDIFSVGKDGKEGTDDDIGNW